MIRIILRGHDFRYEVLELVKVFGISKDIGFITDGEIDKNIDDFFLINEVTNPSQRDKYHISTKIFKQDELISFDEETYIIDDTVNEIERRKKLKRTIKISIYEALVNICSSDIPWGILTGIRPTKIVHELLNKGYSIDAIKGILKKEYKIKNEKIKLITDVALREREYIYPLNEELVSLYVSIPFCPTRCIYCSFPSNPVKKGSKKVEDYLKALYREIEKTGELLYKSGKKIENIYIGGGTPTTLSSSQLNKLINLIFNSFDISRVREFTVEAGRPDTIDKDKLRTLRLNGVDRVSINPQTMNLKTLGLIGRQHTPKDIVRAFYEAREVGFKSINMDIIIGLPEEEIDEVRNTLEAIKKLDPENLTVHTLAVKRSSKLNEYLNDYDMAKEALAKRMLALTKTYASEMDLYPYYMYRQKYMVGNLENIGYCKKDHECIYNMQIMEEKQSIVALGAGSISKIVFPRENRLERVPNVKNVDEYIARVDEMVERKRKQFE